MDIIDTNATSVDDVLAVIRNQEADQAEAVFAKHGFVQQPSCLWHHANSGLYAAVDEENNGFGNRYASVYAHRIINGEESLSALVMVPWYGDGLEMADAVLTLDLIVGSICAA